MRRGDAGCCASAALARPNGPRQAAREMRAKQKTASSQPDHLVGAQQDRLQDVTLNRPSGLPIARRIRPSHRVEEPRGSLSA